MKVSRLDTNNDWTFGRNDKAYVNGSRMVKQNVVTRIKSFKNDWILDTDAHIDWITLLGSRNSQGQILREVERVVLDTDGVLRINKLEIVADNKKRTAKINLNFTTIYDDTINEQIGNNCMKPNFTAEGIQIQTFEEIFNELVVGYQAIYGDIDFSQNTKDGQVVGIEANLLLDLQSFGAYVATQLDPDFATGFMLRVIAKLCGISPRPATFSQWDLTVNSTRDLTLLRVVIKLRTK